MRRGPPYLRCSMPPDPAQSPRRIGLILGALTLPGAVAVGAPSVALPTITRSLDVSFGATAWIIAAWSLGAAIAMPLVGRVAQRRGVRSTLAVAVMLLAVGSGLSAAAPTLELIAVGRFLGGLGVGGTVICIYAYVDVTLTGASRMTALGIIAACQATASGTGTLVGGIVTQTLGWRCTMAVPVLAVLALPFAVRHAPTRRDSAARIDVCGAALLSMTGALAITLLQAGSTHLTGLLVVALAAGFVLSAAGLVNHVRRHPTGFVPRQVITAPGFLAAGIVGLTLFAAYYGVLTVAPELLQRGLRMSTLAVGVALLPAAACAVIAGPLISKWSAQVPAWEVSAVLGVLSTASTVIAATFSDSLVLVVAVALGTIGFTGAQVVLVGLIPQLLSEADRAVGRGLFNFLLYGGGSVGPALVGGLSGISIRVALGSVGALSLLGVGTAVLLRPGNRKHTSPREAE